MEQVTMTEIENIINEMYELSEKGINYQKQVDELEQEIAKLEEEVKTSLDLTTDLTLQQKRQVLPNAKHKAHNLIKSIKEQLERKHRDLDNEINQYARGLFYNREEIKTAKKDAIESIAMTYDKIKKFEFEKKKVAQEVANLVRSSNYSKISNVYRLGTLYSLRENSIENLDDSLNLEAYKLGKAETPKEFFTKINKLQKDLN